MWTDRVRFFVVVELWICGFWQHRISWKGNSGEGNCSLHPIDTRFVFLSHGFHRSFWPCDRLWICLVVFAASDALRETQNKRRREKGPFGVEQSPERKSSGKRRELRPRRFHQPRRPWSDQCQPTDRRRRSRRRCTLMTGIDLWLKIFLAVFKERNRNWTMFYGVFPMYSRMCCCVEWDLSSSSSSSSLLVCLLLWQSVHASVICIKCSQCLFPLRSWLCAFCACKLASLDFCLL